MNLINFQIQFFQKQIRKNFNLLFDFLFLYVNSHPGWLYHDLRNILLYIHKDIKNIVETLCRNNTEFKLFLLIKNKNKLCEIVFTVILLEKFHQYCLNIV